ncbi:Hypothetical protein (Fragment) [Durusdinium trenchii]|uniref:DEUBAD domain-containing protein n=1 Tax=Durusdinium trenchii TaxID=1381693 RepID=A0ABP0IIA8_9DINO
MDALPGLSNPSPVGEMPAGSKADEGGPTVDEASAAVPQGSTGESKDTGSPEREKEASLTTPTATRRTRRASTAKSTSARAASRTRSKGTGPRKKPKTAKKVRAAFPYSEAAAKVALDGFSHSTSRDVILLNTTPGLPYKKKYQYVSILDLAKVLKANKALQVWVGQEGTPQKDLEKIWSRMGKYAGWTVEQLNECKEIVRLVTRRGTRDEGMGRDPQARYLGARLAARFQFRVGTDEELAKYSLPPVSWSNRTGGVKRGKRPAAASSNSASSKKMKKGRKSPAAPAESPEKTSPRGSPKSPQERLGPGPGRTASPVQPASPERQTSTIAEPSSFKGDEDLCYFKNAPEGFLDEAIAAVVEQKSASLPLQRIIKVGYDRHMPLQKSQDMFDKTMAALGNEAQVFVGQGLRTKTFRVSCRLGALLAVPLRSLRTCELQMPLFRIKGASSEEAETFVQVKFALPMLCQFTELRAPTLREIESSDLVDFLSQYCSEKSIKKNKNKKKVREEVKKKKKKKRKAAVHKQDNDKEGDKGGSSFIEGSSSRKTNPTRAERLVERKMKMETILTSRHSALAEVNLREIVNLDVFMSRLSFEHRAALYDMLPEIDRTPKGIVNLFNNNPHLQSCLRIFKEALQSDILDPDYQARLAKRHENRKRREEKKLGLAQQASAAEFAVSGSSASCSTNSVPAVGASEPATASMVDPSGQARVESDVKPDAEPDAKLGKELETKPDAKPNKKPNANPEGKPDSEPDAKPLTEPEAKPDDHLEGKPETKHETISKPKSRQAQHRHEDPAPEATPEQLERWRELDKQVQEYVAEKT